MTRAVMCSLKRMTDITGVDFIAVQTSDHAVATKFYGETLCLPLV